MRASHRPAEEFSGVDPRAPFCRPSVVSRLVRRLELKRGAKALEWGLAHGSVAAVLAGTHGLAVTVLDASELALQKATDAAPGGVTAVRAETPPEELLGGFDLVLLHVRDALGESPASPLRPLLRPEGRMAFVRPVRLPLRAPATQVEAWERHWGLSLKTPQQLLAELAPAGYEPELAETLGIDEMDALYASAPEALDEEAALYGGGAAAVSFALIVGRRREPDERPRPSRDRG
jgi:protein-L-isoaspartate O-methyltransferase